MRADAARCDRMAKRPAFYRPPSGRPINGHTLTRFERKFRSAPSFVPKPSASPESLNRPGGAVVLHSQQHAIVPRIHHLPNVAQDVDLRKRSSVQNDAVALELREICWTDGTVPTHRTRTPARVR